MEKKTKKVLAGIGFAALGVIGGLIGYKKCKVDELGFEAIELDSFDEEESVDEN